MGLENIKPASGSVKNKKRIGRGEGSGKGGTSTKGHKGAKARSGYSKKIGFEGGQQPLQRRVPKFGFNSPNKVEYKAINLSLLQRLVDEKGLTEFNLVTFSENGLISNNDLVKILANGELKSKLNVTAHSFSKTAITAIEKLGGTVTIL
ncbi:MAG: ribosomal protein [Bacteroidota bacterium]|jgi:large subunit ribosomal protein L15